MSKLALIGGHGVMRAAASASARRIEHRGVALLETDDAVWLERHGLDTFTPAHLLDHVKNLDALVAAGCDRVIAISSAGSLRLDWPVGTVVVPDDFYAPAANPTRFDDARGHSVPGFDPVWRAELVAVWNDVTSTQLIDGGVYAQTTGPRFETPAEVRALARDADLVGMTIASECVIAGESGLAYAAVCVVDNLGNGLEATRLTMEEYAAGAEANRERIVEDVGAVIPALAEALMSLVVRDARLDGAPVSLRVENGTIVELGDTISETPTDTVVEGRGLTLTPGLVNAHTHAAMTLFRGYGDDLPLMDWLRTRIWPAEAALTADDVYWGTRLAALEMIRSGTTCFWDMYWFQFDIARAVVDAGLRGVISVPVIETPDAPEWNRIDAVPDALDRLGEFGARVAPSLAAHAIYTVGSDSLRRLAELSGERDVPLQIHLSETRGEVDDCLTANGVRPTDYLDALGVLSERTVLAHGVWLDDAELELIASRGSTIVTNPASNMKLATGRAFPYPAARAAGVPIGIGTDGAASNNSLDLMQDVKLLSLLQKHTTADPAVLPAAEAWEIVTGQCAPALGGRPLTVGRPADFLLVDLGTPESVPSDRVAGLVYSATGAAVDTVVVDGTVLMEQRRVPGEEEVVANAARCAARLRTTLA